MHDSVCVQCKHIPSGPSNRLVQDSCGHQKCRVCLLEDIDQCKQCVNENIAKKKFKASVIDVVHCDQNGDKNNEILLNNHTGVIQINGNVSANAKINGEDGTKKTRCDYVEKLVEKPVAAESEEEKIEQNLNTTEKGKSKRTYASVDVPKHIAVLTDPFSYHCTICDKKFITKTHVKYHAYCAGGTKPYKCGTCHKEFVLRAQLDVHSYKHKNSKPHVCNICKKSFSDRSKLTRHSAVHSTVKSYICPTCGNAYRSKESLRLHAVIHKTEKPYSCKLCSARFNNVSNLNKHVVTHSKEKSHMCDQCGKRFKQKLSLSVHRKSHLRIRPHQCEKCLKAFVNSKDLKRHSLIHADAKGYACGICSTSFRRKDNLRRHMKNTHPGKTADVIRTVVLPPSTARTGDVAKKPTTPVVDNPNAIKVITSAAPAFSGSGKGGPGLGELLVAPPSSVVQSDCRAGSRRETDVGTGDAGDGRGIQQQQQTVINGPIKLAFKTPAFKSHYNINRDLDYVQPSQCEDTDDMAKSIDICQKILSTNSTNSSSPQRNIICKAGPTSEEICQKILGPYSTPPLHYETSFQNRKHAMIKNIKFKVPIQYTNNFKESFDDKLEDCNVTSVENIGVTSVIVNNNVGQDGNMHWRRRTSQNLGLKYS